MLYVHEKVAKLGDVYLGGQVSTVEVTEAASIYVAQDDKGKVKATQPVGYEQAKVTIDMILEDSPENTSVQQLIEMQRLFKEYGQTEAKLLPIVNEDCAARGISQVYFKTLTSKNVVSESKMIASLELIAPETVGIVVVKTATEIPPDATAAIMISPSTKSEEKSPATDSRDTSEGIRTAGVIVK